VWRPLSCLLPLLVVVVAACKGNVEGPAAAPAPGAAVAAVQETKVLGTPPDLAGRWLSLGWLEFSDGRAVSAPMFWEITVHDGKPVLTHRFVSLPPALKTAVDKANADGKPWEPTPDDLDQLRAGWESLQPTDMHVAKLTNEISGRDGFDDNVKAEERSKDSIWLVRQRMDFDAKAAPTIRQVMLYSALAPRDGDYTGNLDIATVAAAPFPVPLSYKGTFRLYHLGEPPAPRGFLGHLLDAFKGCGRSSAPSS
jgi:hypothetical protein